MSFHEPFMLHIKWKIVFIRQVRLRQPVPELLMNIIVNEPDCALEKWLLSSATLQVRNTPEFLNACGMHSQFHDQMRRLAKLINAGRYEQAEDELELASPYQETSMRLARALSALGRVAQSAHLDRLAD